MKFIYSFSWVRCFFGLIICNLLFSVRFVRICNIFCDFNDRNTVKSGNIFAPMLCFHGEMQRYTTFIELYTFLDKDFSTLIENGNSCQFSQAVCAKSTGKPTCYKRRKYWSCVFPFKNVLSWRYLCPFCKLLISFWWEQR